MPDATAERDTVADLATGELARVLEATGHVVRLQVLLALRDEPRSPVSLVGRIEQTLGTISYHFRVLHDRMKLIEIDSETRVRGAVQHHYRLTTKGRRVANDVASVAKIVEERAAGKQRTPAESPAESRGPDVLARDGRYHVRGEDLRAAPARP
jgi:hypothetical protein